MDDRHLLAALVHAQADKALPEPALRRRLREEAGITQTDLATAIGVSRVTISRYESGRRRPRGKALLDYISLLSSLNPSALEWPFGPGPSDSLTGRSAGQCP